MSLNFADLLSTPGAASLFDSSTQASSLPYNDYSSHVDLSLVDFDYLSQCTNPAQLHSIIQQLEHEPFPELLAAARHRLLAVDDTAREAVERKRREGEEKQALKSELEQWIKQQKHKEQATSIDITQPRKQPPIRSSKPTTAEPAEPALVVAAVAGGGVEGGGMSEEEKRRRVASEKQKGNECYKAGEYSTATQHYSAAIALLPPPYNTASTTVHPTSFTSPTSTLPTANNPYDFSLHTNLAMSHLRQQHYQHAINTSSAALTLSHGTVVKAWWRRAQAYRELHKYGEALRDYREGLKRADEGVVRDEMNKEMQRLLVEMTGKGSGSGVGGVTEQGEEKRQVEEERKEKTRADTTTTSDKLKRLTIVEDDEDDDVNDAVEDEKTSSQPVFQAPRGGMTIEVLK